MCLPPWLLDPPAHLLQQDALPDDVDVIVLGGGLGGLAAAGALTAGGARVALFEARSQLGGGTATRAPGLVMASLGEHPGRLIDSVGLDSARQLHGFLAENRAALRQLGLLQTTGSLAVGAMEGEGEEIARTLDALPSLGVPCVGWSAAQVARELSSQQLQGGRLVPEDGVVDPVALVERLVRDARAAGARLLPGHTVTGLVEEASGWHARGADFDLRADAVVLAAGHALRDLVPWFASTVYPVRQQWLATAPLPLDADRVSRRFSRPVLGQHGFSQWLSVAAGEGTRVVAGGARFGTPEMEAGETDDTVIQPRIDHILRSNLARFFPDLADQPVTHAWTAIATWSCDGLPLVGPIPGQVRLVACTATHGLGHSVAVRAGQAVAEGLLTGKAPGVPRLLKPGRLV